MAMAATAATVCVGSPLSSAFCAGASSWECGRKSSSSSNRVLVAASSSSLAASSPVKAGCSSSSIRESWAAVSAINRLSTAASSSSTISRSRSREWRWQAVAEQLQAETEEAAEEGGFPSDTLSVFFEAEGSLPEASVAKLTATLEAVEGVSNVDITASPDGTATVKLTKLMNVQATGVASGLVDVLLKGGFKLQALNLGFDEEDGEDDELYEYDVASSTEESEAAE